MNDCKHEHIVHCPVCDTIRCTDCGKVWTFQQQLGMMPAPWPPQPLPAFDPNLLRTWPEGTPYRWVPAGTSGGTADGLVDATVFPLPDNVTLTCAGGVAT